MVEIHKTELFDRWLSGLRDKQGAARIKSRIDRLQLGLMGDVKPVGEGVSEMRVDYGPGYRVYFKQQGMALILLLAGGDKRTQNKDIKTALDMARML